MAASANFDRMARPYRWLEYLTFGPYLERCRFHFLDRLETHRHALVLGDGDGRFTARLLAANPRITVDAVDSSAAMLRLLTQRLSGLGPSAGRRLRAIHSDALAFRPTGAGPALTPYDLVVTHFFLDCLTGNELVSLLTNLQPHLAPKATWLVSEFALPEHQPAATLARIVIATLYRAFRILTNLKTQRLPCYASTLRQAGFSMTDSQSYLGGLLVAEIWLLDARGQSEVQLLEDEALVLRECLRRQNSIQKPIQATTERLRPLPQARCMRMSMVIEQPGRYFAGTFPNPEPDPDPDPAPDPDPVPLPGPGSPGLDPGFPIEPIPAPVPIT
jgi:SAM-dependent methyltransferase